MITLKALALLLTLSGFQPKEQTQTEAMGFGIVLGADAGVYLTGTILGVFGWQIGTSNNEPYAHAEIYPNNPVAQAEEDRQLREWAEWLKKKETPIHTKRNDDTLPPGWTKAWRKVKGDEGWIDPKGYIWKPDHLHKDLIPHFDVSDKRGKKIKEVDYKGEQIWPGKKNKNRKP